MVDIFIWLWRHHFFVVTRCVKILTQLVAMKMGHIVDRRCSEQSWSGTRTPSHPLQPPPSAVQSWKRLTRHIPLAVISIIFLCQIPNEPSKHCKKLKNCCHGGNNFAKSGHSGWYPCSGDYLLRYFHWLLPSILSLHWLKLDSNPRPRDWFAKPENTNLFAKEDYHCMFNVLSSWIWLNK